MAAEILTKIILEQAAEHIPKHYLSLSYRHPWFDEKCRDLIMRKKAAWGTDEYLMRCQKCSSGLFHGYSSFFATTRNKLRPLKRGSKAFWKITNSIVVDSSAPAPNVPPLIGPQGWCVESMDKATELARTWQDKRTNMRRPTLL